jgi:hypothetical protein
MTHTQGQVSREEGLHNFYKPLHFNAILTLPVGCHFADAASVILPFPSLLLVLQRSFSSTSTQATAHPRQCRQQLLLRKLLPLLATPHKLPQQQLAVPAQKQQQQMLMCSWVWVTVDSPGVVLLLLLQQPGLLAVLLKTAGMQQQQQMIWTIPWTLVIRSWKMHLAVQQQANAAGDVQLDLLQLTLLLLLLLRQHSCWHLSLPSQAAQQATTLDIIHT